MVAVKGNAPPVPDTAPQFTRPALDTCSALEPVQPPVARYKLVLEAKVAKRLVEVALVVVPLVAL